MNGLASKIQIILRSFCHVKSVNMQDYSTNG